MCVCGGGGALPMLSELRAALGFLFFLSSLFCHIPALRQSRWRWLIEGPVGTTALRERSFLYVQGAAQEPQ